MQSKKVWSIPKLDQLEFSRTLSGDIVTAGEDVLRVDFPPYGVIGDPTGPES
jgi:hypothetical protein